MDNKDYVKEWYQQCLLMDRLYYKYASQYQLTMAAFEVLQVLYAYPSGCPQTFICGQLNIAKQTVSNILASFEQKEVVVKEKSKEDGRIFLFKLTQSGLDFCEPMFKRLEKIECDAMATLTEEEKEAFKKTNTKLNQLIKIGMFGGEE